MLPQCFDTDGLAGNTPGWLKLISINSSVSLVEHEKEHPDRETHTQPFYGPLSRTTRVSRYQKIHSPFTHTYHDHQPSFIRFLHLLRYMVSFLFNLRARQSSCPVCLRVHFGLPLRLESSASYSIHFFTQSLSSFCNTRRYHRNQVNSVRQLPSYCNAEFSRDE